MKLILSILLALAAMNATAGVVLSEDDLPKIKEDGTIIFEDE